MLNQKTIRKRLVSGPVVNWDQKRYRPFPTTLVSTFSLKSSWLGIQITESEGHSWPPPSKGKLEDRGGSFYTTIAKIVSPATMPLTIIGPVYIEGSDTTRDVYRGPLVATPAVTIPDGNKLFPHLPPDLSPSDDDLLEYGTTAIARCEPTNSVADLSTALTELMREGLPALVGHQSWKNRAGKIRKNAAGEYLNVQFGLRPLLSEIGDFATAVKKSDQILSQYERDAGKVVRRKYYFPSETKVETSQLLGSRYPFPGASSATVLGQVKYRGKVYLTRNTSKKIWFSGAFTYHLPSGYDSRNKVSELAAKAEHLFGLKFTFETLWNVSPWSWAIDWFANTGDVIHNLEAFKTNGLILRYGYVMCQTITTDTYTFVYDSDLPNLPRVAPLIVTRVTKKRLRANPFGFGVKWSGLSPFQLSIAAALGLTKGRR